MPLEPVLVNLIKLLVYQMYREHVLQILKILKLQQVVLSVLEQLNGRTQLLHLHLGGAVTVCTKKLKLVVMVMLISFKSSTTMITIDKNSP
jgi:hypothetical protein